MMRILDRLQTHPVLRFAVYVGFAVIFFHSGLSATTWLMTPEQFQGGIATVSALLFPVLLPAFFFVNRRFGCGAGGCGGGACRIDTRDDAPPKH